MLNKPFRRQIKEEGYVIIPEVFTGEQLQRLRAACDYVLEQKTAEHDKENPGQDFTHFRNLQDSKWHREKREHSHAILESIADPRCLGPVEQIFGGPSMFYCTSYFINPRYTSMEGNWHRDSQFVTAGQDGKANVEAEKEYLRKHWENAPDGLQFQIALADSDHIEFVPYSINRFDSPEEFYYRLADNCVHAQDKTGMPNAIRVDLKAGDALLFEASGIHRGRYDKETLRRTFMLTYLKSDCPKNSIFSYQPFFLEPGYLEGLSPRSTAYLEEFIHTYKDFWISDSSERLRS